ncbi:hypothetical protein KEJ47_06765 [Candidatus Bathyarchaeota archaeon]|nr:hypothetical protein [Candidatus Bathyarchaeota archaeon]
MLIPLFLISISSLIWASQSNQFNLSISTGSTATSGGVADVTSISQTVTMTWGKAQRIYGQAIFNISNIAHGMVNRLLIHVILTDPQDLIKVFGNRHAYINVTVSDSSNTPGNVYAWDILSEENTEVLLKTQGVPIETTKLYIQVTIRVPGGPPPGQQEKQSLDYYCKVYLH